MSSMTGKGYRKNAAYYTDPRLAEAIVSWLDIPDGAHILEPHVGGGAFVLALRKRAKKLGHTYYITCMDIDPDAPGLEMGDVNIVGDFLDLAAVEKLGRREFDLILGNPPYSKERTPGISVTATVNACARNMDNSNKKVVSKFGRIWVLPAPAQVGDKLEIRITEAGQLYMNGQEVREWENSECLLPDALNNGVHVPGWPKKFPQKPIAIAHLHVYQALRLIADEGELAFLLRESFLSARTGLWLDNAPKEKWSCSPRPSFGWWNPDSQSIDFGPAPLFEADGSPSIDPITGKQLRSRGRDSEGVALHLWSARALARVKCHTVAGSWLHWKHCHSIYQVCETRFPPIAHKGNRMALLSPEYLGTAPEGRVQADQHAKAELKREIRNMRKTFKLPINCGRMLAKRQTPSGEQS